MAEKSTKGFILIILGVAILAICFPIIRNVWTSDTDLIQIKGNLRSANVYVSTVTDSHGHSSQKSDLIFFLKDGNQKYQLTQNIGIEYYDKNYQQIRLSLEKADSVSVWIKKSESKDWQPKVFQMKGDDKILLSANDVRDQESPILFLFGAMGLVCICIGTAMAYPDEFKKVVLGSSKKT